MKFAMIGLRHFHAQVLLEGMLQVPGVELGAIAEEDDAVFATEGERYGVPRYTDFREMLDAVRPEVVGVVNVPGDRGRVIAECLRRGISVLADKPLCLTLEELEDIRQAQAESKAVLFLLLTERYNPPVVALKRLVEAGRLGRIVSLTSFRPHKLMKAQRPAWFWRREAYGGIIVDLAVHDVDVFRWVTGEEAKEVTAAHTNATCPEYSHWEDMGHFLLKATNGVTGFFRVDWLAPAGEPMHGDCRYFVAGTEGWAEVRMTGGFPGQEGGGLRIVTNADPPTELPVVEPERSLYADFVAAVRGEAPAMLPEDILAATRVTILARESADTGRPVRLG
ncbi:MAG: Gfo/Idh/MocA family protein [Methanocella sp.]